MDLVVLILCFIKSGHGRYNGNILLHSIPRKSLCQYFYTNKYEIKPDFSIFIILVTKGTV